jgi:hypothetical protein
MRLQTLSNTFSKTAAILASIFILFGTHQSAYGQNKPLKMFKNYFGTIEDGSAGKGIRGTGQLDPVTGEQLATATLSVPVPAHADILAAFLYWQTLEKTTLPSTAIGYLQDPTDPNPFDAGSERIKILGKPLGANSAATCWSSGGSTGESNGAPTLRVYRADALRYLREDATTGNKIPYVKVMLPDTGSNGSTVPLTEGVSLVVVYRHPALTFKSVVIFDGTFTLNNSTDFFSQTIDGFYQASTSTTPTARITYIVGDGQENFPENLKFNNTLLEANAFRGRAGYAWDNLTYNVPVAKGATSVTTSVDHGSGSFDCVSFGAIIFNTTVQDDDADGLVDALEEPGGFTNLATGTNMNLYDMGARKNQKDLFVEIDHMVETSNDVEGTPHSHLPNKEALELVANAFLKAPAPPNGPGPIFVHFDVGNNYQTNRPTYIIPYSGKQFAGGNEIKERWMHCNAFLPGPPAECVFPKQPGLVSWKKGFQHIKNNFFADERLSFFHYVVFAHGLAVKGEPLQPLGTGFSARSVSGRADLPGDSVVIALGRWRSSPPDAQVGSKNLQATTLLHELAHNLWGFHGGITIERPLTLNEAIVPRPNCNPNKQSVLNYMYQSAGLIDKDGKLAVDLSREVLQAQDGAQEERTLDEFLGLGPGSNMAYRLRWYAPLTNVLGKLGLGPTAISPAKALCSGSQRVENSGVVRVDGPGVLRNPVDWNYDGNTTSRPELDINFNGTKTDATADFRGFNDWKSIFDLRGLQQVGSGRNLFGLSLGVTAANLLRTEDSVSGDDDLGDDDLGDDDLGDDDLGDDDLGDDDLGDDDLGDDDLGEIADIDEATAIAMGPAPSNLVGVPEKTNPRRIVLTWDAPAIGDIVEYTVYRAEGSVLAGLAPIAVIPGGPPVTAFADSATKNNGIYTYIVIAGARVCPQGSQGPCSITQSNPSNSVTVQQ